jgi:hypothetical protein
MSPTQVIREPFHHTDVYAIVEQEAQVGDLEALKIRVTGRVEVLVGLPAAKLPERIRTWIHQICLRHTAPSAPIRMLRGKLAEPIDLASLS